MREVSNAAYAGGTAIMGSDLKPLYCPVLQFAVKRSYAPHPMRLSFAIQF
jgi:hypothetical protein